MLKLLLLLAFCLCTCQSLEHPFRFYRTSKGSEQNRSPSTTTDGFLRQLNALRERAKERREKLSDSAVLLRQKSERMGRTCYFSPIQCLIVWPKDRISSYVEISQAGTDNSVGDIVRIAPLPSYDSTVNIASLNRNLLEALKPRTIERG